MTTRYQEDNLDDIEAFHTPRSRRLVAWVTLLAYVGQPLVAMAQTIADQAAAPQNRPVIDTTANGLPLVQIATPSAAGVSRNQYTQYNVDPKGLILNNSQNAVQTQLGGYVGGNPYLANGSAKIILNEVTGTGASSLNGYTEVAGQRAEVVVANPNGISCNGCGFINTSRSILATGIPIMGGGGSLDAFRVTGGQIDIGAHGLNGANLNQLDLIARSVKINGQLWANNLNVVTGANQVNYADLGVQVIQGTGGKPTVGIDVAQLGGMYANKIRLIGTEAGVGVNSLGTLAAQAGDFTLDSQGRITLGGSTSASGNLNIVGRDGIANSGTLGSRQNTQLASQGDIVNSGMVIAQGNLTFSGANIHSSGTLGAGIDAGGHIAQAGTLTLAAAGRIDAAGQNLAGGNLALNGAALNLANSRSSAGGNAALTAASGDIDLSGGWLQATGSATLNASGNLKNDSGRISGGLLTGNAASISNRSGTIDQTGSGIAALSTSGVLDNTSGAINSNGRLKLGAASLDNQSGVLTSTNKTDIALVGALGNLKGIIESGAALNVAAASLDNSAGRLVSLNGDGLGLSIAGQLLNASGTPVGGASGGIIGGNGGMTIQAGSLNNGGSITALNNLNVSAAGTLDNSNGTLSAGGILAASAGTTLKNAQGIINGRAAATLSATQLDNAGGQIVANLLGITGGGLGNQSGAIIQTGAGQTSLNVSGLLDNSGGTIETNSTDLLLKPQTLINDNGKISHAGQGALTINTGALSNVNGSIATNGQIGIDATDIANQGGSLVALRQVRIASSGNLDNSAGRVVSLSADGLSLDIGGLLFNQAGTTAQGKVGGLIGGNGKVGIAAGRVGNTGSITAGGDLAVSAGSVIMNHQGSMAGNALATFNATQFDNSGGSVYAGQLGVAAHDLLDRSGQFIQGGSGATAFNVLGMFDNSGGRIQSNGSDLRLVSQALVNDGGIIAHAGQGALGIAAGMLDNAGGNIGSNGRVSIDAGSIGNRGGSITSQQQAAIASRGNLENGAGYIGASRLNLAAGGQIDNIGGGMAANDGISMSGLRLVNSGGYIRNSGASALGISLVQDLVNNSSANGNRGFIGGNGDLAVSGAALDNGGGTLYGKGRVALETRGVFANRSGVVQSAAGIGIAAAGALDNGGGRIEVNGTVGTLSLAAASIDNTLGRIANAGTGDSLIEGGASIVNTGLIGVNGNLDVAAGLLRNNAKGQLLSGNRLNLNVAGKLDNSGGTVYAWSNLAFDHPAATFDNTAGEISSGGNGTFNLMRIANDGGKIATNGNLGVIAAALGGNGKILAGGNETVSLRGDYTNAAGNVFSADGDLTLDVTGNLTNQAALQALGKLSVFAANIANQAGASFNSSHTSLAASGGIVNDGRIDGSLIDAASRDFVNTGSVIGDRVELTANNLSNRGNAAVIAATSNVDLWIGNQLSNLSGAEIYSMGNLNIAANAAMDAAGNFTHLTQHILNEGDSQAKSSLIEAGGNINIGAVNLDNRRPQLATTNVVRSVATQTLTPPLDYTKARRGVVPLMNALSVPPPTHTQFFTQDIYGLNTGAGSFNVVGNEHISKTPTVYYDSISPTAVYGYLYQGTRSVRVSRRGSRTVTVTQLINQSDIASFSVNTNSTWTRWGPRTTTIYTLTLNNGQTLTFDSLLKQGWYYDVTYYPGYDPHVNTHPSQLQSSWVMSEQSRTMTTTITDQAIQAAVPVEAQISAGGNLNVNLAGTLTNYISTIAAGGNITVSGSTTANGAVSNSRIVNQGQQLTRTVSTSGSAYLFGAYDCGGFWGGSCVIDSTVSLTPTSTVSVLDSSPNASITAGGSIQAHVGVVTNRASGAGTPLAGSTLGNARDVVVARSSASSAIVDGGQARIGAVSGGAPAAGSALGGIQAVDGAHGLAQTSHDAVSVAANGAAAPVAAQSPEVHGRRNSGELPAIVLPTSGLYAIHSRPNQHYLVETDPRFTSYKNFVSSDYMMSRLSMDPQKMQKRLGDGFYEQRQVTDQITQLTGRRYLGQYASADDQYRALMDAGVDASKQLGLALGIALSSAQVAALNQDIVWMVNRQVTLADGSVQTVLAPVVYLSRNHAIDLKPSGALIAANDVKLKADGALQNSGVIRGDGSTVVAANDIVNRGGSIGSAGGDTLLQAGNDILNQSGRIAGNRVALVAGRNIANTTLTSDYRVGNDSYGASNTFIADTATIAAGSSLVLDAIGNVDLAGARLQSGGDTLLHAGGSLNVDAIVAETAGRANNFYSHYNTDKITHLGSSLQSGGNLSLVAANDLKLTAAALDAGGNASLLAGGNLKLAAVKDSTSLDSAAIGDGSYAMSQRYDETVKGSTIQSGGNLTAAAGTARHRSGDLILESAQLSSQNGNATLMAGGDIALTSVGERHHSYDLQHTESSGLLSSSSSTTIAQSDRNQAVGSSVSGNRIDVLAGHDISLDGGSIAGSNDVALKAGHDINIKAATSTYSQSYYSHTEESGFLSGGGLGITYGNRSQTDQSNANGSLQSQNRSLVGSIGGNLSLAAGNNAHVSGSDLVAGNDLNVAAKRITLDTGLDQNSASQMHDFKQSGLTLSLSSPVLSAAQTAQQMAHAAGQTQDGRVKALAAASAGLAGYNAYDAIQKGQFVPDKNGNNVANAADKMGGINVNVSIGNSSSHSDSQQKSATNYGSSARAGHDLNLVATGGGQDSNITVVGSDIKAGNDASLIADNAINLLAAQNTSSQISHNSSSSNSVGVGFSLGGQSNGFTINVAASRARGNADGHDLTNVNSHVDAANQLTLKSGGDTTLKGAVASGNKVVADVGGNLNIASLQDTSTYTGKQESAGFSASIPIMGTNAGGSVNASRSNINSNFAAVAEQSGIKAGDGGYSVKVKGNTDLKGAVIAASDRALASGKTHFASGGTVSMSDIRNSASYQADASGYSAGVGSQTGASGGTGSASGNAQSTTKSGIGVSTKSDTAGIIKPIFNAQEVTADINAQVQITQAFSQQAPKAVAEFAGHQAAQLRAQGKEAEAKKWDEGGAYRVALHTLSGALSGGAGGAAGAAASAAAAPLMDQLQTKAQAILVAQGLSPATAKKLSQGLAELTSASLGAAAGSVATALTVDTNNRQLHRDESQLLKEKARQIAQEKAKASGAHLTEEQLQASTQYWYDQLNAEATAKVDAVVGRERNNYLNTVAATDKPGLEGEFAAKQYLQDAAYARNVVDGMSGQTMQGANGKPIMADGGALKMFQATNAQYQDYKLFGTTNVNTIAAQFGKNADPSVIGGALASAYNNINERQASNANNSARLDGLTTVNGAAIPVNVVEENILLGMAGKGIGLAIDAVQGAKAAGEVAANTAGSVAAGESVVTHPLQGMTLAQVVEKANSIGLSTQKDNLILWSGFGKDGPAISQAYAAKYGGTTLEMTPGGAWLNQMDLYGASSPFTRAEVNYIWANTSELLVNQASGQVRSVLGEVQPTSIYLNKEIPGLRMNSAVTGLEELYLGSAHVTQIVKP